MSTNRAISTRCIIAISLMLTLFCGGASTALLGASNWLERTVYQVMIDRFATVQDAPASCNQLGFCGGTLAGVQSKLDYIRALGADAIAISPISASESWHGFSPMDLYSVDPRFGTADDLRTLVSEAHAANMLVLLTVQFNHMGGSEESITDYGAPFNNSRWYHDCKGCGANCRISNFSYDSPQLEHCRLGGMPDLNQSRPVVRTALRQWANWLASTYMVDGCDGYWMCAHMCAYSPRRLLVDMAKYVNESFFPMAATSQRLKIYLFGDVSVEDTSVLLDSTQRFDSLVAYPLHTALRSVFERGVSMRYLASVAEQVHDLPVAPYLLSVDRLRGNRFLHKQPDMALYRHASLFRCAYSDTISFHITRNALAFVLLEGGIPMLLYGEEQDMDAAAQGGFGFATPPLWTYGYSTVSKTFSFIAGINAHRNSTGLSSSNAMLRHPYKPVYADDTVLIFQRGPTVVVLTNAGSSAVPRTLELASPALDGTFLYPEDALCDVVTKRAATINGRPVVIGGELGSPTLTLEVFGEPLVLCACYIVNQ